MAEDRIRIPASGGGIVRYMEEYKSKISFKPYWVIVMIIAVLLIEIYLHTAGKSLFGL